ncbi:MAG: hypothetical protein D6782_12415, partial [Alphaproteobacteria bacterium]
MAKAADSATGKLPFKLRLKAWWEGYDPADLARLDGMRPMPATPRAPARPKVAETPPPPPSPPAEPDGLPVDPWDKSRINVAQYIWGPGYCGPGG